MPHWGIEHTHYPSNRERDFALRIIKAGADGIIGSHTHMVQPLVKFDGKPVSFSLGNFLFPDYYIAENRPVYYPSSAEIEAIPSVLGYPKNPGKKLKSVWRDKNRVGAICQVIITNKIEASLLLTRMNDNCVTCLGDKKRFNVQLLFISKLLRLPTYKLFMTARYKILKVGRLIMRSKYNNI